MEYSSAIKRKDIMKFASKWMELGKMLGKNSDPEGQTWNLFTYKRILAVK